MTQDDIKQLLDLVRTHDLAEFELEQGEFRLRVKRGGPHVVDPCRSGGLDRGAGTARRDPAPTPPAEEGAELVDREVADRRARSTDPRNRAPGVRDVGDEVKKGQVLCIIEAMKLMNEIDSECDGEVASIYVENGQPVQYGERLFASGFG